MRCRAWRLGQWLFRLVSWQSRGIVAEGRNRGRTGEDARLSADFFTARIYCSNFTARTASLAWCRALHLCGGDLRLLSLRLPLAMSALRGVRRLAAYSSAGREDSAESLQQDFGSGHSAECLRSCRCL